MNEPKWEYTPYMTANYPIILKDCETNEPYLHFKKSKIKVADLLKLEGFQAEKIK